jgi:hypothetical protein
LKNNLHTMPHTLQFFFGQTGHFDPVEVNVTSGRLEQSEQKPPDGGLAATGLSNQTEDLPFPDNEADVVNRLEDPVPGKKKILGQFINFNEGGDINHRNLQELESGIGPGGRRQWR